RRARTPSGRVDFATPSRPPPRWLAHCEPGCPARSRSLGSTAPLRLQRSALLQLLGLGQHALGSTDVEERLLGGVVELAVDERLERLHRLVEWHEDARQTGEHLAHEERLREEPLDLAGP